jgi:hypothetical protein
LSAPPDERHLRGHDGHEEHVGVERQAGTVSAASAGLGKGSEFTVCLPALEPRPQRGELRAA